MSHPVICHPSGILCSEVMLKVVMSVINNKKEFYLDFIVLNSLNEKGAGFQVDTNKITIIDKSNNQQNFELKSKKEVAADIVQKIISLSK